MLLPNSIVVQRKMIYSKQMKSNERNSKYIHPTKILRYLIIFIGISELLNQ